MAKEDVGSGFEGVDGGLEGGDKGAAAEVDKMAEGVAASAEDYMSPYGRGPFPQTGGKRSIRDGGYHPGVIVLDRDVSGHVLG